MSVLVAENTQFLPISHVLGYALTIRTRNLHTRNLRHEWMGDEYGSTTIGIGHLKITTGIMVTTGNTV